jgi:hypothetical protein
MQKAKEGADIIGSFFGFGYGSDDERSFGATVASFPCQGNLYIGSHNNSARLYDNYSVS